ncbi:MAG: LysM peptidoglycan-binding domain-containing protein, partial [Verrucomicrobia bacterium]|nr:LysM peptidoglycan-binding domain-containing protein [Verrucomicrobiota bacterium]
AEDAAAGETLYTVKKNDTLTSIAKAHGGIRVKALQDANNLKTSQIKPGQKLKLPARSSASPMGAAGSGSTSLSAPMAPPAPSAPMPAVPTNP